MASRFTPFLDRGPAGSICGDIRRMSGCTGRNADLCLIGPTLGSKGRMPARTEEVLVTAAPTLQFIRRDPQYSDFVRSETKVIFEQDPIRLLLG